MPMPQSYDNYNIFIKEKLDELKISHPNAYPQDRFGMAVAAWENRNKGR